MSSWFQSAGLGSAFDSLTETLQTVSDSVQDAIPTEHKELLAKLTLNTEEMISERQHFREEENRKALAKERLANILPWETLDAEREILVEECKESILELSRNEETFFGPFEMPLLNVQLERQEESEDELEGPEEESEPKSEEGTLQRKKHMEPSDQSREMLAKLEPLPPLLENFDLDEHVGMIQKVLEEDSKLIAMQANLSGGGAREKIFWRNYFFHCAFARYEAGLSIDEIWSYQDKPATNLPEATSTEPEDANPTTPDVATENVEEEAIVFDVIDTDAQSTPLPDSGLADETADKDDPIETSFATSSNGFEMVEDEINESSGDPELDELEAEIARELEN